MWGRNLKKQGECNPQSRNRVPPGQPFGLRFIKINTECDPCFGNRVRLQYPNTARFNKTLNVGRSRSPKRPVPYMQLRLVIRNKHCPPADQIQCELRFTAARTSHDQNRLTVACHTGGMQKAAPIWGRPNVIVSVVAHDQTGKPTTNRAPRGSDVMSASVGRMFSAQITPPWASTICLEIARPRPELLPKSSCGRSE